MEFLADENCKLRAIQWLRTAGHEVAWSPKGVPDTTVAELARRQRSILLTHDSDFADSTKFPPADFPGIVWLSLHPPTFKRVVEALAHLLAHLPPQAFPGKLIEVSDVDRFHISPSP